MTSNAAIVVAAGPPDPTHADKRLTKALLPLRRIGKMPMPILCKGDQIGTFIGPAIATGLELNMPSPKLVTQFTAARRMWSSRSSMR